MSLKNTALTPLRFFPQHHYTKACSLVMSICVVWIDLNGPFEALDRLVLLKIVLQDTPLKPGAIRVTRRGLIGGYDRSQTYVRAQHRGRSRTHALLFKISITTPKYSKLFTLMPTVLVAYRGCMLRQYKTNRYHTISAPPFPCQTPPNDKTRNKLENYIACCGKSEPGTQPLVNAACHLVCIVIYITLKCSTYEVIGRHPVRAVDSHCLLVSSEIDGEEREPQRKYRGLHWIGLDGRDAHLHPQN